MQIPFIPDLSCSPIERGLHIALCCVLTTFCGAFCWLLLGWRQLYLECCGLQESSDDDGPSATLAQPDTTASGVQLNSSGKRCAAGLLCSTAPFQYFDVSSDICH